MNAILRGFENWRLRRGIARALALHLRGEVRKDGLDLVRMRNRLEIQWRARGIHPWDRKAGGGCRDFSLFEQLLDDTEAAIHRLFETLPQIDILDLKVLNPDSGGVMLAGTVQRAALEHVRSLSSVRMRLNLLGVDCRLPGEAAS